MTIFVGVIQDVDPDTGDVSSKMGNVLETNLDDAICEAIGLYSGPG